MDYSRDLRPAERGCGFVARQQSQAAHVRFGSEADMARSNFDVRFTPAEVAVIRSLELIVQPGAHDVVGEMAVRGD
jgi:hypothetical protein